MNSFILKLLLLLSLLFEMNRFLMKFFFEYMIFFNGMIFFNRNEVSFSLMGRNNVQDALTE